MSYEKQPCVLLMNDIHISKDNIPEFKTNWEEAVSICKKREIGEIIVGGDVWQSRSAQPLDVLLAVREVIVYATSQGIHLTIAEGNHDLVDQEALQGYNSIFDGYKNVDIVNDYKVIGIGDVDIYVMSYFPENGSFVKRLEEITQESKNDEYVKILYIHEGIKGGLAQPSDNELPTKIFEGWDAVLVGHYHDRKRIPGTKIEYIGASRQHTFGEDEEKGYTIVYNDGSYEFVKNERNTRFRNIEVNYDELDDKFYSRLSELSQNKQYKIKVKVSCLSEEANSVDKQRIINAGATKVEVETEQTEIVEIEAHALDQKFDKSGIKEEYKNFCSIKEINNKMGLAYLDKIK